MECLQKEKQFIFRQVEEYQKEFHKESLKENQVKSPWKRYMNRAIIEDQMNCKIKKLKKIIKFFNREAKKYNRVAKEYNKVAKKNN